MNFPAARGGVSLHNNSQASRLAFALQGPSDTVIFRTHQGAGMTPASD